jgi:hypothetical protein
MSEDMTATAAPMAHQLLIGPSCDGLWIVRDAAGVCGAVFVGREQALHFAKSECEAAGWSAGWRFVPALDFAALFAKPEPLS